MCPPHGWDRVNSKAILVKSKLFWTKPYVLAMWTSVVKSCFWSGLKQIGPVQTNLNLSKTIWTYRKKKFEPTERQGINLKSTDQSKLLNLSTESVHMLFSWKMQIAMPPSEKESKEWWKKVYLVWSLRGFSYFLAQNSYRKVQVFWEDHNMWPNHPLWSDVYLNSM